MSMEWEASAARLADAVVTRPGSRWHEPVATTLRHGFVPRWFEMNDGAWRLCDGPADKQRWLNAAYHPGRSLVTRVGALHADHATDSPVSGRSTSSATLPELVVMMLQCACIQDDSEVLEIGTGSGYSTALLARRLGDAQVTSIDLDPYLIEAAGERLDAVGLHPRLIAADATDTLAVDRYDRLVAMTSVWRIPTSWLEALKTNGRLVTTISDTGLLITADKTPDGGANGQVEWMAAGFMPVRSASDYPPRLHHDHAPSDGGVVSEGRYPIVDLSQAWDLRTMLVLAAPGLEHEHRRSATGQQTTSLTHPDGSWAIATASGLEPPIVSQGGSQRLWDMLDEIRDRWLALGCGFPIHGAKVRIEPDGSCKLTRGNWTATIA